MQTPRIEIIISSVFILLAILVFSACSVVKGTVYLSKGEIHSSDFIDSFSFEMKYGNPIIPVSIKNGGKNYEFLFDMGATVSIISSDLAKNYSLDTAFWFNTTDLFGNSINVPYVMLDNMKIGNTVFNGFVAGVIDISDNSIIKCASPGGIIGANIMKDLIWHIDYSQGKIVFTDRIGNINISGEISQLKMLRRPPSAVPFINLVKDGVEVNMVVLDSGSSAGINIPVTNKQAFEKSVELIDHSTQALFGTGADTIYVSDDRRINIGSFILDSVPVQYNIKGHKTIGNAFLKNFQITADFRSREIYLRSNDLVNFDKNHFAGHGFSLKIKNDNSIIVSSLYKFSPAYLAGLQINDTVTHLNDIPIDAYFNTYCDFYTWLNEIRVSDDPLSIKIKGRGEQILIKPEKYIKK